MSDAVAIGPAAALLGVETHVLRHWEDAGVLVPLRTPTGHRRYDKELLTRAKLIRLCQRAGLSLADIRALYVGDRDRRIGIIADNRRRIVAAITQLQLAEEFLAHVMSCVHPLVSECPQCSGFSSEQPGRRRPKKA